MNDDYVPQFQFSNCWFEYTKPTWISLFEQLKPKKILEVGSFEGQSACFSIQSKDAEVVTCIDPWRKEVNRPEHNMIDVETRFDTNVRLAAENNPIKVEKVKNYSSEALSTLIAQGRHNFYDFAYIDGSHQAPDVLSDAILCFYLTRAGGVMGFDDYLWSESSGLEYDPLRSPKVAIDCFTNTFSRLLRFLPISTSQVYVQKLAERPLW